MAGWESENHPAYTRTWACVTVARVAAGEERGGACAAGRGDDNSVMLP